MGIQFNPILAKKVMDGLKSMTRRPFKPGDTLSHCPLRMYRMDKRGRYRLQWQEGKQYAIQPGRGKHGIGLLEITGIMLDDDVRLLSLEDARAEGFESELHFLAIWVSMYDSRVTLTSLSNGQWQMTLTTPRRGVRAYNSKMTIGQVQQEWTGSAKFILRELMKRPAAPYKAWVLTFKRGVKQAKMAVAL